MTLAVGTLWKALGQSCVIIASVLIAFGIDAWWEDRQEREAEGWLMERLHDDAPRFDSIKTPSQSTLRSAQKRGERGLRERERQRFNKTS